MNTTAKSIDLLASLPPIPDTDYRPELIRTRASLATEIGQNIRTAANDVHYVQRHQQLIPAAETPYAEDPVFGYETIPVRNK